MDLTGLKQTKKAPIIYLFFIKYPSTMAKNAELENKAILLKIFNYRFYLSFNKILKLG